MRCGRAFRSTDAGDAMAKFNLMPRRSGIGTPPVTAEGAPGFAREPQAELFLLGVSNVVGENTFYEGAADRDARFRELVATVAVADPDWFGRFVRWLRTWNLAGYRVGHAPAAGNRHTFGGLSDAAFAMIPLIEAGAHGQWPF
ncbi:hypothetical protein AB0D32_07315 [Micromonospora sp. NPDC048170]|uniref:hypothetical protein n=1 Tax=Micromonospora sp. NPDC048170 TaxID=3154819 RepID=UPI0033D53AD8